tara:strand:- start:83 stop:466 length:384 start_codon:yes stop_codon:yes gene_type:complete
MTSKLQVDNLEGRTTKGSITVTGESNGASTNLQQGLAKTSIRFPADQASITSSFNISSLTDASTGQATVNINNDMNDANYSLAEATSENERETWVQGITSSNYSQRSYNGSNYSDVGGMTQCFGDLA